MYIHSSLLAHIERPHCFPSYVVLHLNGQVIISIYPVPCGWTQVISSFMLFFFFLSVSIDIPVLLSFPMRMHSQFLCHYQLLCCLPHFLCPPTSALGRPVFQPWSLKGGMKGPSFSHSSLWRSSSEFSVSLHDEIIYIFLLFFFFSQKKALKVNYLLPYR